MKKPKTFLIKPIKIDQPISLINYRNIYKYTYFSINK